MYLRSEKLSEKELYTSDIGGVSGSSSRSRRNCDPRRTLSPVQSFLFSFSAHEEARHSKKFAKFRLSETSAVCLKNTEFSELESILLQKEISRPPD